MPEPVPRPADTAALARQLGLSRWAVSRALNDQPGVSEGTRARVRAAAIAADFEPNVHARGLRGGNPGGAGVVGLILPTFRDLTWLSLAGGLCEGLIIRGWQPDWALPAPGGAGEVPVPAWTRAASRGYAAAVVLGATGTPPGGGGTTPPPAWLELRRRGVPVIFVEPAWATEEEPDGLTSVRFDHRAAAALVAGHLHAAGHRRVGLRGFAGLESSPRLRALREACEGRGMTCEPAEVTAGPAPPVLTRSFRQIGNLPSSRHPAPVSLPPRPSRRGARAATTTTLPTALVAADDLTALRALCEHRAAGRVVPRDGSVIGYGDDPAGALSFPALTTVDPQRPHLIARTLELLDELWRDPGNVRAGRVWIAPLLRCRGSVADVVATSEA